jgi:hypothetical protein
MQRGGSATGDTYEAVHSDPVVVDLATGRARHLEHVVEGVAFRVGRPKIGDSVSARVSTDGYGTNDTAREERYPVSSAVSWRASIVLKAVIARKVTLRDAGNEV